MKHEKRKFVEKLDYLTSPGWLDGPDGRARAGLTGGGPSAVITDKAVMRFEEDSRKMFLSEVYPGVGVDDVQENMGFQVDCSKATEAQPPSARELEILRRRCDPQRLILG